MIHVEKKILRELFFFGIVGVITLLIDVAITTTLYNVVHLPAYLASGIGFLSGFFFNFPMNRKRVFQHDAHDRFSLKTQIVLYAVLTLFNLLATSLLTQFIVSEGWTKIAYAKIMVTALIAVWNFIIFKLVIFSKKKDAAKTALDERTLGDIL
ncbi:MAG TPA: GtrA family protein [Candidatus Saccharimonadales bacterium]|nr:GtrA family protein [Candidatus Saccharimonadales bacterium]